METKLELAPHRVEASFSFTYNLGNYNSLKISASVEDRIEKFSDFGDRFEEMVSELRFKVLNSVKETIQKLKADSRET